MDPSRPAMDAGHGAPPARRPPPPFLPPLPLRAAPLALVPRRTSAPWISLPAAACRRGSTVSSPLFCSLSVPF
uniref:Uncharacterized protein n=1 Tax=Arundo donax TaxID=35708 RepID=A0A0A9DVR2_ARUDO